jgi:hypothetical protein
MAESVTYRSVDGQQDTWRRDGAVFHARWNRLLWQWVVVVEHKGQRAMGNGAAKTPAASIRHIGDGVFACKVW